MQEITIVSGETAHPRVMLGALTEATVRHLVIRRDREITVSMRERGKELLPSAEDTKAELIASNLAMQYAVGAALQDPEQIPAAMELSVRADECYCGRLRFICPDPEEIRAETDAFLLIVSPGAPMLAFPCMARVLELGADVPVCTAILWDRQPSPADDPAAVLQHIAPALYERIAARPSTVRFYHPSGFLPDGEICSPENAAPYGVQALFWDLVKLSSQRKLTALTQEIQRLRSVITRRNSDFQALSPRRTRELAASRAAYAAAVSSLYEAQCLLAAESGASLTRKE